MTMPKNPKLYENVEYETDQGMYSALTMELLVRHAAALAKASAGQTCPKCQGWEVLFFGDPDGNHWCAACQIVSDFELEGPSPTPNEGGA